MGGTSTIPLQIHPTVGLPTLPRRPSGRHPFYTEGEFRSKCGIYLCKWYYKFFGKILTNIF